MVTKLVGKSLPIAPRGTAIQRDIMAEVIPSLQLSIRLTMRAGVAEENIIIDPGIGIAHGADMVRVHDIQQMVRVCRMSDAIVRSRKGSK